MSILLINSAEPEVRLYVDPIAQLLKEEEFDFELRDWQDSGYSSSLSNYNAVVISASPIGNNDNFEQRLKAFSWIKNCQIPLLGICAGHQLIGSIYGSKLICDSESEKGESKVLILDDDPIFTGCPNEMTVIQQHHDSISLPAGFNLLATSTRCRVQAIRHQQKPIYGVQWHAELSSKSIIRNFISEYADTH